MYDLKKSIKNIITYNCLPPHKEGDIINIGYGIDNNYARCAGTSIVSFCVNNPEQNFRFHILASDLSSVSKEKFKLLAENYRFDVNIYEIDSSFFDKLPTRTSFPVPTYYRFVLPLILKNLDKIFYVDADIICLNNTSELFNKEFDDNILMAVPDTKQTNDERNKDLGLLNNIYFNAGVLGINVRKWNEFNIFDTLITELLKDPKKFYMLDQDALNLILTGKVKYLPRKFNWFNGFYKWEKDSIENKDIILLHFTSSPKPWDLGWSINTMCNKYNINLYNNYEKLTPWANLSPVMPKLSQYKKLRLYSRDLKHHGYYWKSFEWYIKYLLTKIKYLMNK